MPSTQTSTLSLHDALPISNTDFPRVRIAERVVLEDLRNVLEYYDLPGVAFGALESHGSIIDVSSREEDSMRNQIRCAFALAASDRKSTRLNSSHSQISYAVHPDLHSFPTRRSSDLKHRFSARADRRAGCP